MLKKYADARLLALASGKHTSTNPTCSKGTPKRISGWDCHSAPASAALATLSSQPPCSHIELAKNGQLVSPWLMQHASLLVHGACLTPAPA